SVSRAMMERMGTVANHYRLTTNHWLSKQKLADVRFQKKRFEDFQAVEQPDDVAVLQRRLPLTAGGVRLLLQRVFVHDHVFREPGVGGRDRREKTEQRPVRTQQLRQRASQH